MSEKIHLPWKNGSASCSLKWIRKTVISAPHTSYLILSMPVPLSSCYATLFRIFFFINISNLIVLFVYKKILNKKLSRIPAYVPKTPVSVFTFSRFCVHLFSWDAPARLLLLSMFFLRLFWTTPAVVLCVLLPLLVFSSLIFVLYVSGA